MVSRTMGRSVVENKWYIFAISVQLGVSALAKPIAYLHPTYCVLMWSFLLQTLYWFYEENFDRPLTSQVRLSMQESERLEMEEKLDMVVQMNRHLFETLVNVCMKYDADLLIDQSLLVKDVVFQ